MVEFDKIYVVWRKGVGERRHAVGLLQKLSDGRHEFNYFPETKTLANVEGFTPYTEFPDLTKTYNGNVAEIFGQRLTKLDRPDIKSFLSFWEVDEQLAQDKFYLLGKTQGLVATDNFEFLAEYQMQPNTHFLTELASLSKNKLEKGILQIGDQLSFQKEADNLFDEYAVKVYKNDLFVGYIKKYHSKVFYQQGSEELKLSVKAMEQNGYVKRVFVKITT